MQANTNSFHYHLVIYCIHKYIDTINIPFLINNPALISSFPIKETYPKISFKYSQTLGSMVFNYTKFSKEIVIDNIDQYHCECEQSDFNDDFHNHIATGNLDVLGDQSLIDIFKFGSKFRVIPKFNVNNIITTINNNVDEYIHKWSFKLNVVIGHFAEWKTKFMKSIRDKINSTPNTFPSTINLRSLRNKIRDIQDKFIIMPVDKAKLIVILDLFAKTFMHKF